MIDVQVSDSVLRVRGLPRDFMLDGRLSGLLADLEDAARQAGRQLVSMHHAGSSALPDGEPIPTADLATLLGINDHELEDVLASLPTIDGAVERGALRAWALGAVG